MRKDFQKLIDKVMQSLDWDTIYEVNKVFKFGVGGGSEVIPGLKRKPYSDTLTKNDVKNELKFLLRFVINNDISKFVYGQWMIFWFNQDWDLIWEQEEGEEFDENEEEDFKVDSRLEVFYAPQRISLTIDARPDDSVSAESIDSMVLSQMLQKALDSENYELAGKLQELLDLKKSSEKIDK
jgi:hypothetical protein